MELSIGGAERTVSRPGKVLLRVYLCLCLFSLLAVWMIAATIPSAITKTVVFIYRNGDGLAEHADGTGFLVSIPVPSHPDRVWVYLVTAKHVLHTDPNDFSSPIYPELYVRMNRKSGDSVMDKISLVLSGEGQTVFVDPDESVDIAVVPIAIKDVNEYDLLTIPESFLVTADDFKKYNIGVGCDTFFTGMFAPYQGQKRNYPIVRFGRLSMLPDEKIKFGNSLIDAYLVETFSFGGNSGSPVFFYPSADNTPGSLTLGPPTIKLAGVMKGFFGDLEPVMMAQTASTSGQAIPVSKSNSGIAVVVPAKYIAGILHSASLENKRSTDQAAMK